MVVALNPEHKAWLSQRSLLIQITLLLPCPVFVEASEGRARSSAWGRAWVGGKTWRANPSDPSFPR